MLFCRARISKNIPGTPRVVKMYRWNIISIPLEKNPHDSRDESWKIQGSKQEWDTLKNKVKMQGEMNREEKIRLYHKLWDNFGVACIEDLNNQRPSLGIVKPDVINCYMKDRKEYHSSVQTTLNSKEPFLTIHNYEKQPRVKYRCSGCKLKKPHNQQILEWGVYEWMRKNKNNTDQGLANLHLMDPKYDKLFVVGNMNLHRNAFMVISVLRFKRKI